MDGTFRRTFRSERGQSVIVKQLLFFVIPLMVFGLVPVFTDVTHIESIIIALVVYIAEHVVDLSLGVRDLDEKLGAANVRPHLLAANSALGDIGDSTDPLLAEMAGWLSPDIDVLTSRLQAASGGRFEVMSRDQISMARVYELGTSRGGNIRAVCPPSGYQYFQGESGQKTLRDHRRLSDSKSISVCRLLVLSDDGDVNDFLQAFIDMHFAVIGWDVRTIRNHRLHAVRAQEAPRIPAADAGNFSTLESSILIQAISELRTGRMKVQFVSDREEVNRYNDFFDHAWQAGQPPSQVSDDDFDALLDRMVSAH